jgi:hypothetical protein
MFPRIFRGSLNSSLGYLSYLGRLGYLPYLVFFFRFFVFFLLSKRAKKSRKRTAAREEGGSDFAHIREELLWL